MRSAPNLHSHGQEGSNVSNRIPIYATAALIWTVACSPDRPAATPAAGADANRPVGGPSDAVTVAGCLSGGPDGRFVLTAAPDPGVTTAARPGMGERDTNSYVLVGGANLQQHIGKRVEVSGTLAGRRQEIESEARTEGQARPTGTSGAREQPKVETKAEVDVEIRQLNVSAVRELDATCKLNP
jgi:hypothetical protein